MDSAADDLAHLMALLRMPGLPRQVVIADAAQVDQALVSLARNGRLKRITPRVERLLDHVRRRVRELGLLDHETRPAALAKPRSAPKRVVRRTEVLRQVDRYLADGFDSSLLIQQLAVLRRAQKPRAGRPPKA